MKAKLYRLIVGVLIAVPVCAQSQEFLDGSQVIASPTMLPDRWELCTVEQYIAESDGYQLSCESTEYFVPSRYVLDATEQNAALLIPPAARDLLPAGTEVLASPLYLPDRWERCFVAQPLYENNGYELNCNSIIYVVSRTQVLPVTEENLRRHLPHEAIDTATSGEKFPGGEATFLAPTEAPNQNNAAVDTLNADPSETTGNYYPGMIIEASPIEGVWGDAVIIEKVEGGFRVQMLPGIGYIDAPQLVVSPGQMRQASASTDLSTVVEQPREPDPQPADDYTEQPLEEPEPRPTLDAVLTAQALPNGVYYCGKSTGGMVFFMGEIELRDGLYRGPAYDGQFGDWYPLTITAEGTLNWGGPLGGFESDASRVVSTAIKSDGGRPAFDVLLQMASGNFMSISCVPKH